ncbi:type IX secretion system membrane protein PorP/SprF [Carboxylicivirga sediminis]|uniref:Type IX secretion system membrane protein PorP/SprF n=1 Tax=Carboxylicivirga sediminis TaxID=2006564 RepID=A0A941J0B6_9BACT|nr:type IX secretion system membrane protein PorP/SprF [Carboxylicivirga sediminis]MBR8538063.1 type IX secretion system membrane protein PorP/SprF [Carboxylicivirga sediminis]
MTIISINNKEASLSRRNITKYAGLVAAVMLLWLPNLAKAQQDPMYTQYMFNTLAYNPAYAGSREVLSLMALSRHQWVGFEGAPSTQTLTAHSSVGNNVGLGFTVMHDRLDPTTQSGVYFDYAYRIRTSAKGKLSFGIKGGFNFYQNRISSLSTGRVDEDPSLLGSDYSKLLPNFGFGLFYYTDKFYLGASIPKLLENKLADGDIEVLGTSGKENRHYFITSGYVFDLSNSLKFKPSILARFTQAAPMSMDINLNLLYNEKFWFGGFYRLNDAFGAIVQYQFNQQFKVGYGYDMTTSELSKYNNGTHEIMLLYEFNFTKEKVQHPRYF